MAMWPGIVVGAFLLVAAAGCAGDSAAPDVADAASSPPRSTSGGPSGTPSGRAELPIDEGGPLVALPSCQPAPPAVEADVPGLLLPEGTVVTKVQQQGPLVNVLGYVELTPIEVRQFYEGVKGLELLEIEDEIYEAEALFAGPKYRSYVKAQAKCQSGSTLIVFVGPGDTGELPEPGGG